MTIMQRLTDYGHLAFCHQTDAEYEGIGYDSLMMLDAYILAHVLDTTESFKAHQRSHEQDCAVGLPNGPFRPQLVWSTHE